MKNSKKRAARRERQNRRDALAQQMSDLIAVNAMFVLGDKNGREAMNHLKYAIKHARQLAYKPLLEYVRGLAARLEEMRAGHMDAGALTWLTRSSFPLCRNYFEPDVFPISSSTRPSAFYKDNHARSEAPPRPQAKIPSQAARFQNYRR